MLTSLCYLFYLPVYRGLITLGTFGIYTFGIYNLMLCLYYIIFFTFVTYIDYIELFVLLRKLWKINLNNYEHWIFMSAWKLMEFLTCLWSVLSEFVSQSLIVLLWHLGPNSYCYLRAVSQYTALCDLTKERPHVSGIKMNIYENKHIKYYTQYSLNVQNGITFVLNKKASSMCKSKKENSKTLQKEWLYSIGTGKTSTNVCMRVGCLYVCIPLQLNI